MTALWITIAVVVTVLMVWRLRRAAALLDRILREERAITERQRSLADPSEQPKH